MADITGATPATSYDLPNYVGEVFFQKNERPNSFLRLIGALGGGGAIRTVGHWEFAMGVNYTLGQQVQGALLEGADPVFTERDTTQATNVLQIFQEGVQLTYSAESSQASVGGLAVIPGAAGAGSLVHPRSFEFQVARAIETIQNRMNYTFLRGAYQKPANNATARKVRGVRTAVTTNATNLAAAALTKANFESTLAAWMGNGMFQRGQSLYLFGDAATISKVSDLYETVLSARVPDSREVAGIRLQTIVTKWADIQLVWEPDAAPNEIFISRIERVQAVAMPIITGGVNKGLLFREELAHTGATSKQQVYGEWGVDYTDEIFHGVITNYT